MATSICANLVELLQGRFHDGKDERKQSGIESDSLQNKSYKEWEYYPGNQVEKKNGK